MARQGVCGAAGTAGQCNATVRVSKKNERVGRDLMSETFLCQHPRRSTAETGNELLPGDWVELRSFAEIRATLDEKASLEAMPFMPGNCSTHPLVGIMH